MKYIMLSIVAVCAGVSVSLDSTVNALRVDDECKSVEAIFARGSGQTLGDVDYNKFLNAFDKKVPQSLIQQSVYELGYETYGGHKYKAVEISEPVAIGAKVSSGYANEYGGSVDSGVGELYNYLIQRHTKCEPEGTKFVLAGYSQGAQVIGQTLPKFNSTLRSDIAFAAFYGDPKLNLPEGYGAIPPACRGKEFSLWRRTVDNCRTSAGSLNKREPYLPEDMRSKSGLWCYKNDYICGSTNNVFNMSGHAQYRGDGRAIDLSVNEVGDRLKSILPEEVATRIPDTRDSGQGTTGLDVAFVLDTTGSMGMQIESSKEFIRQSAQKIKDLRGRVALTVYRDAGDSYTSQIISPLQADTTDLLTKLDTVYPDGGGDTPEAGLHALMTTFNGLNWQDGATKASIMLTDAPFHSPDVVDGVTIDQVAQRSLEIDPVNVYPVLSQQGWLSAADIDQYEKLASLTSGQVIIDSGDTVGALSEALTKIEQRPTALLKNLEYQADTGQEITFDASDSYVLDATITKYDWDFDGDGAFDLTTSDPIANHTYSDKFDGNMQVRLTASNGTIASASAIVKVGTYVVPIVPVAPENLIAKVLSTSDKVSSVELSWLDDVEANGWLISVNDVPLGVTGSSQTSIEITDVKRDVINTFSVAAVSADSVEGETSIVELGAEIDIPAPEQPKLSWWQKLLAYLLRLIHSWKIA